MKTLCIKMRSGVLITASLALLIFLVKLNVVTKFEKRVSRDEVLKWVGEAISHTYKILLDVILFWEGIEESWESQ